MEKFKQKELLEIAKNILKEYDIECKIKFKDIRRGRATRNNYISIPKWAYNREGSIYALYYVLHEVSHQICIKTKSGRGHNEGFKTQEKELLSRYNLIPKYARAYAKELIDKNGNILWKKSW